MGENKFNSHTGICDKCLYISDHSGLKECPSCGEKADIECEKIEPPFKIIQPVYRPTFEHIYMSLAKILSLRSTCSRRQVGCVITSHDYRRVLSVGYNGNASGLPNECDYPNKSGGCGCLHAEENAVMSCSEPPYVKKVIFTTTFPCKMCAKRIIQLGGVLAVYYLDEYHDRDAEKILEDCRILSSQVTIDNILSHEKSS